MEERTPRNEICFLPMKHIQAIESFSQVYANKVPTPQGG